MSLITPDFGLLVWMVLIFGIVFFVLAKWGFPLITGMVDKRSDRIEQSIAKAREADGFVFGTPVYYAHPSGRILSFLDRVFYTARFSREAFAGKPAAVIVSARRMGTTSAIDVLNKYVTYMEMPLVSGRYWAAVHGRTPEEVRRDEEGVQTVKDIADNMVWLLRCLEAGRKAGIEMPEKGPLPKTHFIR